MERGSINKKNLRKKDRFFSVLLPLITLIPRFTLLIDLLPTMLR